jgi:hypothetical protein
MADSRTGDIFQPGHLLNSTYRIDQILGRGGTSEVYKAKNDISGRFVAIKVLKSEFAGDEAFLTLMRREEEIREIRHDAIVRYSENHRTPEGLVYLVMDYVDGPGLDQLLKQGGMAAGDLVRVCRRVADGLKVAHARRIIHRDLSPDNIILKGGNPDGAVIIDFGIAKDANPGAHTIVGNDFAGKYAYAAPEQLAGHSDTRSDLYALGALLLATYRGKRPDPGGNPLEVLRNKQKHLDTSGVPEPLKGLIDRMSHPDPAERFQSADELVAAIDALDGKAAALDDRTVVRPVVAAGQTRPTTVAPRPPQPDAAPKSRMGLLLGAGAVVVIAGGVGAWLMNQPKPAAPVQVSEVTAPEVTAPDAKVPDAKVPDAKTPVAKVPDAPAPPTGAATGQTPAKVPDAPAVPATAPTEPAVPPQVPATDGSAANQTPAKAPDAPALPDAAPKAADTPPAAPLTDAVAALPVADPYALVIERPAAGPARAVGDVPSATVADALRQVMAQAGGSADLTLATGAIGATWGGDLMTVVQSLAKLDTWRVNIIGNQAEVSGTTADAAVQGAVLAAIGTLPGALKGSVKIDVAARVPLFLTADTLAPALQANSDCGPLALVDPPTLGYGKGDTITVTGRLSKPDAQVALYAAVAALAPDRKLDLKIDVLNPALCQIETALPAVHAGDFSFDFQNGHTQADNPSGRYFVGENPVIDLVIPPDVTEGYVSVSIIDVSGNVYHLLPNLNRPDNAVASLRKGVAGPVKVRIAYPLSDNADPAHLAFVVDATSLGKSKVVVIHSQKQLFAQMRPTTESAGGFAEALKAEVDAGTLQILALNSRILTSLAR